MKMLYTQEDLKEVAILIVTVLSVLPTVALLDFAKQLQDTDQIQEMDVSVT